jgi:hypothetical protein
MYRLSTSIEDAMNKLLIALIAGAVASITSAQTTASHPSTRERRADVQALTVQSAENSGNALATAAEQAMHARVSPQEKRQFAQEATRLDVNPENSSGTAATAAMQRETTALSRTTAKQNAEFRSQAGKQELYRVLRNNSTG